jgi:hypothetical protein
MRPNEKRQRRKSGKVLHEPELSSVQSAQNSSVFRKVGRSFDRGEAKHANFFHFSLAQRRSLMAFGVDSAIADTARR